MPLSPPMRASIPCPTDCIGAASRSKRRVAPVFSNAQSTRFPLPAALKFLNPAPATRHTLAERPPGERAAALKSSPVRCSLRCAPLRPPVYPLRLAGTPLPMPYRRDVTQEANSRSRGHASKNQPRIRKNERSVEPNLGSKFCKARRIRMAASPAKTAIARDLTAQFDRSGWCILSYFGIFYSTQRKGEWK